MNSSDVETRRSAVGSLINISVNAKNKAEIRTEGGITPLIQCLNSTDSETRRYALRAIYNVTINGSYTNIEFLNNFVLDENKSEFKKNGGFAHLVNCLKTDDLVTKRYALLCMTQFVHNREWITELIKFNALGPIFQAFHSVEDDEVIRQATIFLSYLMGDKELEDHLRKRLQKSHSTPILLKSIIRYFTVNFQYNFYCSSFELSSEKDREETIKSRCMVLLAFISSISECRSEMIGKLKYVIMFVLEYLHPTRETIIKMSALECYLHLSIEEECKTSIGKIVIKN